MKARRIGACVLLLAVLAGAAGQASAQSVPGEIKGTAWQHTDASLAASASEAQVVLPSAATGGAPFTGKLKDAPAQAARRVPVVLFLHGSSGLGLKAIGDWQAWLATLGIASVAPDSFALPQRVTYTSPIAREAYERIHALRASEIAPALAAIRASAWADPARLVLAGTSEGSPAAARHPGAEFAARMLFAWSCEDNYFVSAHRTQIGVQVPVLNVISTVDPFFSQSNAFLGNPAARGHCGDALKDHKAATIVLVPGAPHTLLNLPQVRSATRGFLADVLGN